MDPLKQSTNQIPPEQTHVSNPNPIPAPTPTPTPTPTPIVTHSFIPPTPPVYAPSSTQRLGQSFQKSNSFSNPDTKSELPRIPANIPVFIPDMPRRSSNKWFAGISIAILLLLAGLIYGTYALIISPSRAIPTAFSSINSLSKKHVGFLVTLDSDDPQMSSLSFSVTSDIDKANPNSTETQSRVYLESKGISVAGDFVLVNGVIYGQLTNLPDMLVKPLSKYMNHWYSLTVDVIKRLAKIDDASLNAVSQQGLSSISGIYERLYLEGVFKNANFAGFTSYNGKLVRRYSVDIDKDTLAVLVSKFASNKNSPDSTLVNEGVSSVSNSLSSMEFRPVIITVDLLSGSLEEIKLETHMSIPATRFTPATDGVVRFILTYGPVEDGKVISAPQDAESLDNLLVGMFTRPAIGTSTVQSSTTKPKSTTR